MEDVEKRFNEAAEEVRSGGVGRISQDEQLELYGLYSVVRKGSAGSNGPSAWLDPAGFAKWSAWESASHLNAEEAMLKYIELVEKLSLSAETKGESGSSSSHGFGNRPPSGFDIGAEDGDMTQLELDLCYWATIGDAKSVQYCLNSLGVSANYRDRDNLTALMRAADRNELQIVDILVAGGANMDERDEDGQTALHYAAYCEHAEMAALLITYGASVQVRDKDGMTALEVATGETAEAMQSAIAGDWKRTSAPFESDPLSGAKNYIPDYLSSAVVMGSLVVIIGIVMYYRIKR